MYTHRTYVYSIYIENRIILVISASELINSGTGRNNGSNVEYSHDHYNNRRETTWDTQGVQSYVKIMKYKKSHKEKILEVIWRVADTFL